MNNPEIIFSNRGLSYPVGFKVSALNCGIKDSSYSKKDLCLLYSESICNCIGVFTENQFKAHPVSISQQHIKDKSAKALIVNSGNANCLNGEQGYKSSLEIVKKVAECLNIRENEVIIASTGTIGKSFPLDKVLSNISNVVSGLDCGKDNDLEFAEAITTTDTKLKLATTQLKIKDKIVKIAGVAKGAGMICPNLATMLAFFTTDANISKYSLDKVFKQCINQTFGNINVDGQTSTNDMTVIFANGLAENDLIDKENKEILDFEQSLLAVCRKLAYDIINDAEGATKVIRIRVKKASTQKDAKKVANSIAESLLVKTFIYGQVSNWGRVVQTIGKSDAEIDPQKIDISVNDVPVFKNGAIVDESKGNCLKDKEICICINLNIGNAAAEVISCDLSPEYVEINSVL